MDLSELEKQFLPWPLGSQLKDHIYELSRDYFRKGDQRRDEIHTEADVKKRQDEVRSFFTETIGGLPSSDTPLDARITGRIAGKLFDIEKIIFQSRPFHYVTAHLYLPHDRPARCPAVLFLCGHHHEGKFAPEYQVVCQILAQAGLIILAQDPIGQGERFSYYDPSTGQTTIEHCCPDHDYAGAISELLGDSIARYFLHDAMRGVDYLSSRPEVDPARIGVTGNSGGGTQTSLMMLGDPRLAAAAPGTYITNRDWIQRAGLAADAEQNWAGFTREGFDHEDILLAMAPKPVCVLAVKSDFFPIEGTRRTVARSRRLWEIFGKKEELQLVEDASVHHYTVNLARACAKFFALHLGGRDLDPSSWQGEPLPFPQLWCTSSGQVRGDFPQARFVYESNLERLAELDAARKLIPGPQRSAHALDWLQQKIRANRTGCDLNPKFVFSYQFEQFQTEIALWSSQPSLLNSGFLFRHADRHGQCLPVTVAVWPHGTKALVEHAAWLRKECAQGRAVLVVNLSGVGPHEPDPVNFSPMHGFHGTLRKLQEDFFWLGDSLAALRTHELLRVLDLLKEWPGLDAGQIAFYGHGRAGLYVRLAAALDPRIKHSTWNDGFTYRDMADSRYYDAHDIKTLMLPGALRHFDLSDLDAKSSTANR